LSSGFGIETLQDHHGRAGFHCGSEPLDRYFREQVTQDVRRRATACYVALAPEGGRIAGCYTLATGGVPLAETPGPLARRLPRCPSVPVARMGRLAVNEAFQGGRLGAALLWDAAARAARSEMIVFALVVDVKDDAAASFYGHHGFVGYGSSPRQLLLPLARLKPPAS
jgi:ribosomal protein S18 acetylase RimI-like enzyme